MPERATYSDFVKAQIAVLNEYYVPVRWIPVRFNPTEYSLSTSAKYGERSLPGLDTPIEQFVSGGADTLSMELLFDTYEEGVDVRTYTVQLDDIIAVGGDEHAPPVCRFVWGSFTFRGVLSQLNKRFTMFLPSGVPVRARVNVTFRQHATPAEQTAAVPRLSSDRTTVWRVTEGDTLWAVASAEYGDPERWRPIAKANDIDDPRTLEPGRELVVPPLGS